MIVTFEPKNMRLKAFVKISCLALLTITMLIGSTLAQSKTGAKVLPRSATIGSAVAKVNPRVKTPNQTTKLTSALSKGADTTTKPTHQKTLISTAVDTMTLAWNQGDGQGAPTPFSPPSSKQIDIGVYKSAAFYFLLFVLLCVFINVVGKALKAYELTNQLQGRVSALNWNKIQSTLFAIALIVGLYGAYWCYTVQGSQSVREAATQEGEQWDFMFHITWVITTLVFVITHILLFGFSFKYRASTFKKAYFYPHNNALERVWTIIPAIVLTILVLLGFFTWRGITNVPLSEQKKAINIEVTGEQFKWSIRYAGTGNILGAKDYKLITATNPLGINFNDKNSLNNKLVGEIVLPVNKPVRFTIGSKDVLHSFYIPAFRAQIYAVPGMPTYFQFVPKYTTKEIRIQRNDPTFDYVLLCNRVCGTGHYNMQAKVTVVSEEEYNAWLAKQPLLQPS